MSSSTLAMRTIGYGASAVKSAVSRTPEARQNQVLLIEDNPADVRLIREALKETVLPLTVNVAVDGADALNFLLQREEYKDAPRPELILLDLNLPKKSGSEVLQELKSNPDLKRIPVIVMTTSRAEQDIRKAYDLNANCYITKPVDLDLFLQMVRSIQDFWFNTATLPS